MRNKLLFVGIITIFLFVIAAIDVQPNKIIHNDDVFHFKLVDNAGIPHQINYQGYLADGAGTAITDTLKMAFRIYDTPSGGTELWSETQSSVPVINGLFNVLLGSVTEIPSSVFGNPTCWLQIEIEGEVLSPRKQIVSVGYAFRADTANFAVSAAPDNDWQIIGNNMYSIPTGNVGIGTDEPQTTLDIYDSDDPAEITLRTGLLGGSNAINFTAGNWIIKSMLTTPPMALSFLYGSDEVMTLKGENVGIGTTSPTEKLDVNGNAIIRGNALEVVGGPGSYIKIGMESEGYATTISYESDTSSGMYDTYIRNSCGRGVGCDLIIDFPYGNVGIGTASPTAKLDVAGTVQMTGFKMPTGASAGYVLTSDASGVGSWQPSVGIADSDWTISGTNMYSAVSGNVGIGTSSPEYKLDVIGTVNATAFKGDGSQLTNVKSPNWYGGGSVSADLWRTGNIGIGVSNPSAKLDLVAEDANNNVPTTVLELSHFSNPPGDGIATRIQMITSSAPGTYRDAAYIDAIMSDLSTETSALSFWTRNSGTMGERVRIDGAGRVGIGTTNPNLKLTIYDSSAQNGLEIDSPIPTIRIRESGTPKWELAHDIYPDKLTLYRYGLGYVLTVDPSGNVGIGTTNPQSYKLYVNGKAVAPSGWYSQYFKSYSGNYLYIDAGDNGADITIKPSDGNVGIGTTSPNYKLDVAGDINTSGDVRKNGTAYNNPDYVFEPGYKLMSLRELKKFITENKHLPNMPSTDEIRREGVKIFEQNRLLLEKLEEAYLYIIELEERIAKLEEAEAKHNVEH